ncbi:hypothetical protein CDAR_391601 [Caerostris darwini]|uniref:Uncharacterized protein n=1 Tax=Caerostris darwini TaxID=1538125 RepID=A0AAV4QHT2_9ARAC|nr:hypothetical protein CDAR_391601 [Caerostris darwini]
MANRPREIVFPVRRHVVLKFGCHSDATLVRVYGHLLGLQSTSAAFFFTTDAHNGKRDQTKWLKAHNPLVMAIYLPHNARCDGRRQMGHYGHSSCAPS